MSDPLGKTNHPDPEMPHRLRWLATEMNDRTSGNQAISLDWGNHTIYCSSPELKNMLVALVVDYLRLRKMTDETQVAVEPTSSSDRFVSPVELPTPYERELLVILTEECAEVQQRATKMLRFGVEEIQPGQELSNKDRLSDEIGDLFALVDECEAAGMVDWDRVIKARKWKCGKLRKYTQAEPQ